MSYDRDIHRRRSIRLRGFDYAANGAYYVTICTYQRECLLGQVVEGEMVLSPAGEAVRSAWAGLEDRFSNLVLDESTIMPNHIHGIIFIVSPPTDWDQGTTMNQGAMNGAPTGGGEKPGCVGARFIAPGFIAPGFIAPGFIAPEKSAPHPGAQNPPLGEIVRAFKAVSTRLVRRDLKPEFAWQRNYYERILRNDEELDRARRYIRDNPIKWHLDANNTTYRP